MPGRMSQWNFPLQHLTRLKPASLQYLPAVRVHSNTGR